MRVRTRYHAAVACLCDEVAITLVAEKAAPVSMQDGDHEIESVVEASYASEAHRLA